MKKICHMLCMTVCMAMLCCGCGSSSGTLETDSGSAELPEEHQTSSTGGHDITDTPYVGIVLKATDNPDFSLLKAGAEHEAGKATRLTAILEAHAAKVKLHDPSVHHPDDDKGRHKRKQAYRPHVVVEKQRLPHPEEPDIQWLHIGIRYILIGECQPVVLGNGFVGNTDIAQLVAWREVTQDERWESCYQEWYVLLQKMEKTHETDD